MLVGILMADPHPNSAGVDWAAVRVAWEKTPETAQQIAARVGVTKNVIIAHARRRGWKSFTAGNSGGKRRTLFDRLDEVWAKFDAAMKDAAPKPSHYTKVRGDA